MTDRSKAETDTKHGTVQRTRRASSAASAALKRTIAFSVAAALSALILTSALPPLVADQSDRAVVDAPVMLLTAPIAGDVQSMAARPADLLNARAVVAEVVNPRVDRTTLIALDGKQTDTAENLRAIRAKRASDAQYLDELTVEIARQSAAVTKRYEQQLDELRAQVGSAGAAVEEKKQIVGHQTTMVQRDVFAPEMAKAATQQYTAAKFQQDSSESKLQQKQGQLDGARKGLFVGDDVHDLAAMIQKKRDMQLDVQRLSIEETQVAAAIVDQTKLLDAERTRLASLERATVAAPGPGEVLDVGAAIGRHVSAGDTLARMVNCDASFVVAIFSYRQGVNLAVGTRVTIDAGPAGLRAGTVAEVLPKTSDKVDETYAVPFPQTERRELYVLVKPDSPLRTISDAKRGQCDIGQWVTVTRANGWVPSFSVLWRTAGRGVAEGARAIVANMPFISQAWAESGPSTKPYGARPGSSATSKTADTH